jgi:ribonuclease HII
VDGGNLKLNLHHPYRNIPKADSSCFSVACASIVAKVVRDKIMDAYDRIFPQYGFSQHKGYGTNLHFQRIKKFGPSLIHRRSFYPVNTYATVIARSPEVSGRRSNLKNRIASPSARNDDK